MEQFRKNLFSELRLIILPAGEDHPDDTALQEALTMNENLRTETGYIFQPRDLIRIAWRHASAEIYADIKAMIPEVKSAPMYPDFPNQVMAMDEAVFRLHQMIHYFSTYGLEYLFDEEVSRGWLPEMTETPKTETDRSLLETKVLSLTEEDGLYRQVYEQILMRRERMTVPEKELVEECVRHADDSFLDVKAAFKENLIPVFRIIMEQTRGEQRIGMLKGICQNSGDVFKCAKDYIRMHHYHLRTSEKRAIVQTLEQFSAADFRDNLMHSNKKREDVLMVLQFTDSSLYFHSPEHLQAVSELRDDLLRSWESRLKTILLESPSAALEFAAKRPGELLRKTRWLLKNGVDRNDLQAQLVQHADELSTQTLVRLCGFFKGQDDTLFDLFAAVLQEKMKHMKTPLDSKRIYVDEEQYAFDASYIETNEKSAEGGYIRSGMAFRIPEDVHTVRFFTYWDDKEERIDIDLHGFALKEDGETVHIGWDEDFRSGSMVHSGDITHSDAAEYIDVDLQKAAEEKTVRICLSIHSYTGQPFAEIQEVRTGLLAVSEAGLKADVKLYNPANCFFSHELRTKASHLAYGIIDPQNRLLILLGREKGDFDASETYRPYAFSLNDYLALLCEARGAALTDSPETADLIVKLGHPAAENEISLLDANFFMDAPAEDQA